MPVLELTSVARPKSFLPPAPAPATLREALAAPLVEPAAAMPSLAPRERQEWNASHGRRMRAVEAVMCASVLAYFAAGLLGCWR